MERTSPRSNLYQDVEGKIEDAVSGKLMTKAVTVVPCGHVLNEDTVTQCLSQNKLCPIDRQPINRYIPNYTIRRLAKLDPPLVQGFRVLFRKQEGTSWFVIIREFAGCIKGFVLQKENRLHPIDIQGIPSTLKLEDLDRARNVLAGSSFRITDCQIEVLPGFNGEVNVGKKEEEKPPKQTSEDLSQAYPTTSSSVVSVPVVADVDSSVKITKAKVYSKIIFNIGEQETVEFDIHEVVKIAVDLIENLKEDKGDILQIPPERWNFIFDDILSLGSFSAELNNGYLDCLLLVPVHVGGMKTIGNWLYVSNIFKNIPEDSLVGSWVNIGGRILLIKHTKDYKYYTSDHGFLSDIVNETKEIVLNPSIPWTNPYFVQAISEVLNKMKTSSSEEIADMQSKYFDSIVQDPIETLKNHHPDLTESELREIQENIKNDANYRKTEWKKDEALIFYLVDILAKKYCELMFSTIPRFQKEIYERYGFEGEGPQVADQTIRRVVLAALAKDINQGKHQPLFRPVFSYGDPDKGAPYHEFAAAIETYFCSQNPLSSRDLAKKMRELLSGREITTDDLSFLPNLVGSWFIAEVSRNPVAMMTGLILLDILEEGIELKDTINGNEENLYSWKNILIHPLNEYSEAKVQDLYGSEWSVHKWGGAGTMCNKDSVDQTDQTKNPLSNGRRLSPSRQKEGSLLLHWLSEYFQRHEVEFEGQRLSVELSEKKLEKPPQYFELENRINERNALSQKLEEWQKQFNELKQREKEGLSKEDELRLVDLKKEGNKLSKNINKLDKSIPELNKQIKKLKIKKDVIERLLLTRLNTLENLLSVGSHSSPEISDLSRRSIIATKLVEEYPEIALVLVLYSKLKGQEEVVKIAFEEQVNTLPSDIRGELQKLIEGKNLHDQLVKIAGDIYKTQNMIPFGRNETARKIDAPPKVISNNGRGLRCGYYAMGAGILQLPEDKRLRILRTIKLNSQCLKGNIEEDQYTVGDQLFRYSIQHNEIFTGPVQTFVNTMVAAFNRQQSIDVAGQYDIDALNQTIIQIQADIEAEVDIYADRIQILGNHLGINCYINGGIYGGGELDNAHQIDIYNPQGGHYESVDRRSS